MKTGTLLSLTLATVGLLALAAPAQAQRQHGGNGGSRGGGQGMSQGGAGNRGGNGSFSNGRGNYRGGGHYYGGRYYGGHYYGGRGGVNFYVGGFGYPYFYGSPYYYGYGYPYGYAYAPYYGYSAGYTYDPQGVYEGRVVPRNNGNRYESDGKDHQSSVEARVQERLAQDGYYRGAIDGVIGDGTRRAIRSYERANGLHVDGRIDDRLLSTMGLG